MSSSLAKLQAVTENDVFADVMAANVEYADAFDLEDLDAHAAKGLAVLTCMDSRIDPLGMLGLQRGDAKILRNAGARVTNDALRTLVLASHLLSVKRVMVVPHTGCRMTQDSEDAVHTAIGAAGGPDTRSIGFLTTNDQEAALALDVQRIRSWPFLGDVTVGGFLLDLQDGRLRRVC